MQKIRIDFDNPGLPQHISAVENDSQSRFFQATLYENGKAYTAPEGAAYSIMYRGFGPQNQGWYDTINDGAGKRAACAVSGNVVTCEIARQALQVPGHVSIVLCVTTGKGYMLKSWPIECDCKNDRYDSTVEIQSFFYVTQVSNADWTQAIQAVEELKNTIDPALSLSGKAADAKATGDAVGELKEDIDKYIIKRIKGSVTTSKAPHIVLRYACKVSKGDVISVKSKYDGDNIQTYDIRFYDASGNIHIIATAVPIGKEYIFVAEENYSEISLFANITNPIEGKKFETVVSIHGELTNEINQLDLKQKQQEVNMADLKTDLDAKYNKESINILDISKASENKSIDADTGKAVDNQSGLWLASDFIKLNANTRYCCNGIFLNGIFGFYTSKDANTFVKSPAGVEMHGLSEFDYKKGYIETGASELYFRCSIASEMKGSAYISEWVNEYVPYQALLLKDFIRIAAEASQLKGKKILVIGDSISTDYYGSYPKWVTALIKAHYLPLDTVNNSIHATGFVADAGTTGNDFLSRLKAVENKSSFDLVIVFGGINDYSLYKQEDSISTIFTNAVDAFFEYLVNNYVNARFGVIKPMLCNRPGGADNADKIRLYADYIAGAAKKYAIPALNMTDESGFNPFITQLYERWSLLPSGQELHDGIHPNEEFERKFMAPQIKHFIDGLI